MTSHALLPAGAVLDGYAQRTADGTTPLLREALRWLLSRVAGAAAPALPAAVQQASRREAARLTASAGTSFDTAVGALAPRLRREGFGGAAAGEALALVGHAMQRRLGKTPYDTQQRAAWLLLNGHLVEMATGEGKTLAAGLAAAVAGIAGIPVHVLTANDYLVQRDRETLLPVYDALGLSSASLTAGLRRDERAAAYRHDIVYATARELVFDYLQDHLALRGERDPRALQARLIGRDDGDLRGPAGPVVPGLHFAIVDEADSLLLDEACVPLVLSAPRNGIDVPAHTRAYELACTLQRDRDYRLDAAARSAALTDAGRARLDAALDGETGALRLRRRAFELVEAALAARLLYRRDREYAVTARGLVLIDELTGRIAEGRQWSGALHPMVQLKEGLVPSAPLATVAQITYQRFFPRYLRLAGMSGTLLEARHELRVVYGVRAVALPLARPSRRRWLGQRIVATADAKWQAVVAAVREHGTRGRPVLVGTASVAESAQLSACLAAAGVEHQVLNAVQDADEAARIARAGVRGSVTVATNIAGRGTDIQLDADALAAGGLHVIAAMRNRSARIDRQLIGRAARHGDPGSAESIVALDDLLIERGCAPGVRAVAAACLRRNGLAGPAAALFDWAQRRCEWHDRRLRRRLRLADRQADDVYGFTGGIE